MSQYRHLAHWLLLGALSAFAVPVQADASKQPPVFEPCELTGSAGNGRAKADCARWQRPLNPAQPDGEQIELFVARIKAAAPNAAKDAFTLINGGPGAASTELYVDLAPLFEGIRRERDIIVIDQRGTGRSTALRCPELEDAAQQLGAENADVAQIESFTQQCLANLTHDPRFFTTSQAVADLDALRDALHYDALTLYGVSYGTRVVQHYTRRYPERARALIIDGVLPAQLAMGPMVSRNAQRTFDLLLVQCAKQPACKAEFPDLAADFARLKSQLLQAPVEVRLPHPSTGLPQTVNLTWDQASLVVRLMSYAPETMALLPVSIDQAANNQNYLPLAAQSLRLQEQLGQTMNYGMHNAVVCTEDIPFLTADERDPDRLADTYLGGDQLRVLLSMCGLWPQGAFDEDIKTPFTTERPTLVLSGELDPITPPEYGQMVGEQLPNAVHIVAQGQGHGVLARGCIPRLIQRFVEQGSIAELDVSCAERLGHSQFFVDLMGPAR